MHLLVHLKQKNEEMDLVHLNTLFQDLDDMNVHRISLTGASLFIRDDFFRDIECYSKIQIC